MSGLKMKHNSFDRGFYCGALAIGFCYFLAYGPWFLTLGCVLGMLFYANWEDTVRREGENEN